MLFLQGVIRTVAMKSRGCSLLAVAAILLMPLDPSAETAAKVYRIGCLDTTPPDLRSANQLAFYEDLRQGAATSRARTWSSSAATRPVSLTGCRRSPGNWLRFDLT